VEKTAKGLTCLSGTHARTSYPEGPHHSATVYVPAPLRNSDIDVSQMEVIGHGLGLFIYLFFETGSFYAAQLAYT
jgi:hypothetical protein